MENMPIGGFNLPSDFFDDDYTLNFTVVFVEALRVHRYSGKNWSSMKCLDYREAAFFEVEPSGGLLRKVAEAGQKVVDGGGAAESEMQVEAADAAYAIVGLVCGVLSSDDPNPVISRTKSHADMFSMTRLYANEPFNMIHATCITTNTISKRTKERYGERFNPNW